ncbi:MAG: thioredoxin domain-containing protein [Candidatus Babeliales bacterium]
MIKKYLILSLSFGFASLFTILQAEEIKKSPVIAVSDNDFETKVLKAKKPVIVDFFAEWCGPCKKVKPTFEKLATQYANQYIFVSIDIDVAKKTAAKYKITQIPTFAIFNKGKLYGLSVGTLNEKTFEEDVKKTLAHNPDEAPLSNAPQIPNEMLLLQAITTQNTNQIKQLIKDGVDVNHKFKMPVPMGENRGKECEYTPLSIALSCNLKDVVETLLDAGASLDFTFKNMFGQEVNARQNLEKTLEETIKSMKEMLTFLDQYQEKNKK